MVEVWFVAFVRPLKSILVSFSPRRNLTQARLWPIRGDIFHRTKMNIRKISRVMIKSVNLVAK
jgi:hypothetical protein